MKEHILTKQWGIAIFIWLLLAICVQPVYASTDEIKDEEVQEQTTSTLLEQDEIGISRPFQMQVMVSASGNHRDRSTNPGAALHLGYRVSKLMYVGLTSQAFSDDNISFHDDENKRYDDEEVYGQEGVRKTTVKTDPRHLLEMRFFPWRFGLYFSAGLMHFGQEKTVTEFKSRPRIINENEYTTGLTTSLEYKEWTGAATGIGFHHMFNNGFSLSGGVNVGLATQKPEVTIESDVTIAAADLEEWKDQIETNEKRIPVMFNIGIGYAF